MRKKTLDPKFDESFRFGKGGDLRPAAIVNATLRVRVWDYDMLGDHDPLGEARVRVGALPGARVLEVGSGADVQNVSGRRSDRAERIFGERGR